MTLTIRAMTIIAGLFFSPLHSSAQFYIGCTPQQVVDQAASRQAENIHKDVVDGRIMVSWEAPNINCSVTVFFGSDGISTDCCYYPHTSEDLSVLIAAFNRMSTFIKISDSKWISVKPTGTFSIELQYAKSFGKYVIYFSRESQ